MFLRKRTGEGGQGHKGKLVLQTSIKMTSTPALKIPDPPKIASSLLFNRHTCKCPHTLGIPSLNSTYPCREREQLLAIRAFCGHEITPEISSRKQEEGDKSPKQRPKRRGVGRREGALWISSAVKWAAHMC